MSDQYLKWRPHPWHGLEIGERAPEFVNVFVEITPFDHVKYEIDKVSGFLKVDRPQYTSSLPPTLYGFIPRTLSGERVRQMMDSAERGDDDPLDVCVVSSHSISHPEVLLSARVVGGIPMLDGGEADDKIVAVLSGDGTHGHAEDIGDLPPLLVEQLAHYFKTYKRLTHPEHKVVVGTPYGAEHARCVVEASVADYCERF